MKDVNCGLQSLFSLYMQILSIIYQYHCICMDIEASTLTKEFEKIKISILMG